MVVMASQGLSTLPLMDGRARSLHRGEDQRGRAMPSFDMRLRSVLGFSLQQLRRAGRPSIRHRRMSRIFYDMATLDVSERMSSGARTRLRAGIHRVAQRQRRPRERMMARCSTFSSSRTLPGQSYCSSVRMTGAGMVSIGLLERPRRRLHEVPDEQRDVFAIDRAATAA